MKKRNEAKPVADATLTEIATAAATEKQTDASRDVVTELISSSEEPTATGSSQQRTATASLRDGAAPASETEPAASHVKSDDDRQSGSDVTSAASGGASADGEPPPALVIYRVLSPIKLGGRIYPLGAPIELTAEKMLEVGATYLTPADVDHK